MNQDLRILSWNCAGHIARKTAAMTNAKPDILVLSEAEEDAAEYFGAAVTGSAWRGRLGHRGVSVIAFNGWSIEPSNVDVPERLFLPVIARKDEARLNFIGACVQKTTDYVSPTLTALEHLADVICDAPTILTGDFNQSVVFDKRRGPARKFATVVDRISELGLRSAWHSFTGEEMGAESKPTLYSQWRDHPRSRFHIDYTFVSEEFEVVDVEIGSFQAFTAPKISDHVPLKLDLGLVRPGSGNSTLGGPKDGDQKEG
jgi:hypothetical protein